MLKLGRQPRAFMPSVPHMSALKMRAAPFAAIPTKLNYADPLPADLGMMLNGPTPGDPSAPILGDCTSAGVHHARQLWTRFSKGQEESVADADVLAFYERFGYQPGNPATDQGAVEQQVLTSWLKEGMPTPSGNDQLVAFIEVDPHNLYDVRRAIYECGLVYIGFSVPDGFMETEPQVWDANPAYGSIVGGHCVILTGYDEQSNFNLISWGRKDFMMTPAFMAKYVDEVYALVDYGWVEASKLTPLNMTIDQLDEQMTALRSA